MVVLSSGKPSTGGMGLIVNLWHLEAAQCKTEKHVYVSEVRGRAVCPDIAGEPLG